MSCPTKISEIRRLFADMVQLDRVVDLLRFLATSSASERKKKNILRQWANLRAVFADVPIPSDAHLQDALLPKVLKPSSDWCDWYRKLAESRDLDAYAVGAIAGRYDAEIDIFDRAMRQLPRCFREALGPAPWAVRVRLPEGVSMDDLDDAVANEVRSAGGPQGFGRSCTRWWQIKAALADANLEIEWPHIEAILEHIGRVLDDQEAAGERDFAATLTDVETMILDLVDRDHPEWLTRDGGEIAPSHQKQLLAGVLQPPARLIKSNLESAIRLEFAPEDVGQMLDEALNLLFERGELDHRVIEYLPTGGVVPVERSFLFRGFGSVRAAEIAPPESREPLSDRERAVLEIIRSQPKGKGITGKEIREKLLEGSYRQELLSSTLTTHIIPRLKDRFGIENRRGIGYFIP